MELSTPSPKQSSEHVSAYQELKLPVNFQDLIEVNNPSPVTYKWKNVTRSRSRSPDLIPKNENKIEDIPKIEDNFKSLNTGVTINSKASQKPSKLKKAVKSDSEDDMFVKTPSDGSSSEEQIIRGQNLEMDDTQGYFIPQVGEILLDLAAKKRYKIQALKGKGVYSCVVQARDLDTNESYAIKILRNIEVMIKSGHKEIQLLTQLNDADPRDRRHILRIKGSFQSQSHLCICFEELSMNLREVLNKHAAQTGLSLDAVRS